MTVEVRDYDPRWPRLASAAGDEVLAALSGAVDRIEHIGSRAVPGLAAKPVIDLMAATADLAAVPAQGAGARRARLPARRDRHARPAVLPP